MGNIGLRYIVQILQKLRYNKGKYRCVLVVKNTSSDRAVRRSEFFQN